MELRCLLVCAGKAAAQLQPNLAGHNYQNACCLVTRTKKEKGNWDAELELKGGKQQCKGVDLALHGNH